ncbi:MAG: hypothetical protein ACOYYS_25180 [Chloroflexota bacterium]
MLLYSPDGRWLAAASTMGVTLYDPTSLEEVWAVVTEANVTQIAFSEDGATLTGVDASTRIYTWRVSDGKALFSKVPEDLEIAVSVVALSPDGTMLAVPYYDDSIHLYRTGDAKLESKIAQFLSLGEMIYQIVYSPDGERLATLSFNGDIRIWSVSKNKMLSVLSFDDLHRPYDITFVPDGRILAVGLENEYGEKSIRMLDVYNIAWKHSLEGEMLAFSTDKSFISVTPAGIALRDYFLGNTVKTLPEEEMLQGKAAFSPDGASLAIGTSKGIRLWRWEDGSLTGTIPGAYANYTGLALAGDGLLLAAGTAGGIEIRKVVDGSLLQVLALEDEHIQISAVAYAPAGDYVAGASEADVYVWGAEDGALLWSADAGYPVNELAFSPDGTMLAAAVSEGIPMGDSNVSVPVWSASDGFLLYELEGAAQLVMPGFSSVVFSPDGSSLVAAEGSGSLDIWELTGSIPRYNVSNDGVFTWDLVLAFSPDGSSFAAGGMDRQISIWRADRQSLTKKIDVADDSVTALVYSPDGQMLASGVAGEIRLWQANSGKSLCTILGSGGTVIKTFFTPDGRFLVSLAKDGVVRVWGVR